MKKLLAVLMLMGGMAYADENAYFKAGPLELTIPFKTARVVYLFDFNADKNLVGAETPIASLWGKIEGTAGVVTSLDAQGSPFVGGNILLGNVLDRWITLPEDFAIGGFGAFDFHTNSPMYGLKASLRIWG